MEKDQVNNIILGGGIAGLIWAYFHPEYAIISKELGGQFKAPFSLGPKYLHVDEYTKRFVKEMKLTETHIRKIKIGFFFEDKVHSKNTDENRIRYFKKTRGLEIPYESAMSADKTEFDAYDIGPEELTNHIVKKVKNTVIRENVKRISLETQELETDSIRMKYNQLVSTIPLNIFLKLAGKEDIANEFKYFSTTFVLLDEDEFFEHCLINIEDYDYIYFSDDEYPFHRITKTPEGIVAEYKTNPEETISPEKDVITLKVGQLIENDINVDFQNVKLFGRYGTWKHEIKVNQLLKEIYETKKDI